MAGKKKTKKPPSNPARGFATTSSVSKNKSNQAIEEAAEVEKEKTTLPLPTPEPAINKHPNGSLADESITSLTPEQLELQLEESELQILLETHGDKSRKQAARYSTRLRSERRVLRGSAESFRLPTAVTEEVTQPEFGNVQLTRRKEIRSGRFTPKNIKSPLSEEDLIVKAWTLQKAFSSLGFADKTIEDGLVYLLKNSSTVDSLSTVENREKLWGAEECLDYLALLGDREDLPGYEGESFGKQRGNDHDSSVNVGMAQKDEKEKSSDPRLVEVTKSIQPSVPARAKSEARDVKIDNESRDSDSDIDPKDQLNKYLQFKTRIHNRRPDLTVPPAHKSKKSKGRATSPPGPPDSVIKKLQQRIRKLERDLLFDREEAEEAWSRLRIRLESEAAESRRAANSASADNVESETPDDNYTASGSAEDQSYGIGEFFLGLPDHNETGEQSEKQSNLSIQDVDGSTIFLRDFGTISGVHPRRILHEACKSRDSSSRITILPLSSTSFSNRHRLSIKWSHPQPTTKSLSIPGLIYDINPKEFVFEMCGIACPEKDQSEAYICSAALFLVFSRSPKEEKVYLRLPSVWRGLWAEFSEIQRAHDDAEEREELRRCRDLVRMHRCLPDPHEIRPESVLRATVSSTMEESLPETSDSSHPKAFDLGLSQLWHAKTSTRSYQRMLAARQTLPIWEFRDELLTAIANVQALIVCGETGCGKSTQLPSFILEHELCQERNCRIYCTQPRRISAISLAKRVSEELGETRGDLGTTRSLVGYAIRLESQFTAQTKLIYATTGIVMRMLENEVGLDNITHLILDEVHERTIDSDFLLIFLRRLLNQRPELKVILMSATVNAEHFSNYLGGAPIFNVPGRTFPVETRYLEDVIELTRYGNDRERNGTKNENEFEDDSHGEEPQQSTLQAELSQYSTATREALSQFNEYRIDYYLILRLLDRIAREDWLLPYSKAILVFLPGIGEIRRLNNLLVSHETFLDGWIIHPLHSTISTEEQERAFHIPSEGMRKIVLATNIAETGITIPDITCVIDSGKHKEIRFDERRQLSRLLEGFISRANAKQRRGRAGRVQRGLCFHLFTRFRHDTRMAESQTPEMLRLSLQDLALRVKICKMGSIEEVLADALDPPLARNVRRAVDSLIEVKALTSEEELTSLGRQLAKLPLDVYLGKLLLFSSIFKCADAGLSIAAILTSKSPFMSPMNAQAQARQAYQAFKVGDSDLQTVYHAYCSWRRICQTNSSAEHHFCRKHFLNPQTLSSIEDLKNQLAAALLDAGFLNFSRAEVASLNIARTSYGQRRFLSLPSGINENSENENVINSVIAWSFYPKLLVREGKGYRNVANNQIVTLHPSSVNKGASQPPKYLSYYHIMQASSRFYNAHETNAADDLQVALFCGDAEAKMYSGVLVIDGNRLRLSLPDWRSLAILKAWRAQFRTIVAEGIEAPGRAMSTEQQKWFDMWQRAYSKEGR